MELPKPMTLTELMGMAFPYAEEAERDYRRGYCDGFYAAMDTLEKLIKDDLHQRLWDFLQNDLQGWRIAFERGESPMDEEPPQSQWTRARRAATSRKGIVYIVQAEGTTRIKIGRSTLPGPRLASLETASPYRLKVLRQILAQDSPFLERMLHQRYQRYRQKGEWFEIPRDILHDLLQEEFG